MKAHKSWARGHKTGLHTHSFMLRHEKCTLVRTRALPPPPHHHGPAAEPTLVCLHPSPVGCSLPLVLRIAVLRDPSKGGRRGGARLILASHTHQPPVAQHPEPSHGRWFETSGCPISYPLRTFTQRSPSCPPMRRQLNTQYSGQRPFC